MGNNQISKFFIKLSAVFICVYSFFFIISCNVKNIDSELSDGEVVVDDSTDENSNDKNGQTDAENGNKDSSDQDNDGESIEDEMTPSEEDNLPDDTESNDSDNTPNTPDIPDTSNDGDTEKSEAKINYNNGRVTIWAGGINPPGDGELILESPAAGLSTGLYVWYESENTQWYNVAKTLQGDSNMCWAITAVNILHWWSERNRENILEFIEKKSLSPQILYLYDTTYNPVISDKYNGVDGYGGKLVPLDEQKQQSRIADIFRGNAERGITAGVSNDISGGYASDAFAWYLYSSDIKAPSLYREVFSSVDNLNIIHFENDINSSNFTSVIKTALDDKRVLAMDFNTYNNNGVIQHCVNIWGAVFNNDGIVTELWIGDSNYKQNRIFNWKIKYKDNSVYLIPAYMDASADNLSALNKKILYITSFADGSEIFRQYLDNS